MRRTASRRPERLRRGSRGKVGLERCVGLGDLVADLGGVALVFLLLETPGYAIGQVAEGGDALGELIEPATVGAQRVV